jgi:hypothetical protein
MDSFSLTPRFLRLFAAGALLLLCPTAFSQDDVGITCRGTVLDWDGRKPLFDATVVIINTETKKNVTSVTTDREGVYQFGMPQYIPVTIHISKEGYKDAEKKLTLQDLLRANGKIAAISLDTVKQIVIPPKVPIRQSKAEFTEQKLAELHIVPVPAAYLLLRYLNPDLDQKDSLMSNEKIVLPIVPKARGDIRKNKEKFQHDKSRDPVVHRNLRDSLNALLRIVNTDFPADTRYETSGTGQMQQLKQSLRADLESFRREIDNTSRLKADGVMALFSEMMRIFRHIEEKKLLTTNGYAHLMTAWEDLSYLLDTKSYVIFQPKKDTPGSTGSQRSFHFEFVFPENIPVTASPNKEDEVGVFGFVVCGPGITPRDNPDLGRPSGRYIIRYFKPAFQDDTASYKQCQGNANVAVANLTRARYGVDIYDTEIGKYVQPVDVFIHTDKAFQRDALLVPDFKEIKIIPIWVK